MGVPMQGLWTLTRKQYLDHGVGSREYDLQWKKVFHGIELPSFVNVGVDADTGEIIIYSLVDDPVVIPLPANILDKETALRKVARDRGWTRPVIENARLAIWYVPSYPGRQTLLWRFELRNPDARNLRDSFVWADVDAVTGKITRLGLPGGTGPVPPSMKSRQPPKPSGPSPRAKPDLKAARKQNIPLTVFETVKTRRKP
jgi:hypothetical protein